MKLFQIFKKDRKSEFPCCRSDETGDNGGLSCCCSEKSASESVSSCCCSGEGQITSIRVLGAGCKSCHMLYENTQKAVADKGLNVEVEYITDMEKIMNYNIMSMPALVVNEKVVSYGKVLKPSEIEDLL